MSLFEWNRPVMHSRRMVFEQLEERIVLDASIGLSPNGVVDGGGEGFWGLLHSVPGDAKGSGFGGSEVDHTREVDIKSNLLEDHTVYMLFNGQNFGPGKLYSASDFPGWTQDSGNPFLFSHNLPKKGTGTLVLNFDHLDGPVDDQNVGPVIGFNLSLDKMPSTYCDVGQAELALHAHWACCGQPWKDTYDISLVNGFNYPIRIDTPYPEKTDPYTPDHPVISLPMIQAATAFGNSKTPGVFGYGNDQCCASCAPPVSCCTDSDKIPSEAHPSIANGTNCSTSPSDPHKPCPNIHPVYGAQCVPRPFCQFSPDQSDATGKIFTVTFG
ncbi:MAG: hypothetical protein HY914_10090 [Desulfomonile tiedjei]|nr:hypothetical protein [Desulfomonile tiedjei]